MEETVGLSAHFQWWGLLELTDSASGFRQQWPPLSRHAWELTYMRVEKALPRDPISCPALLCTCDCLKSPPCQLCSWVIPTEGIWACSPQPLPSALGIRLESTVLANADFFKASVRRVHIQNHLLGVGRSGKWKTCSVWRHLILLEKIWNLHWFIVCRLPSVFFFLRQRKPSLNLILNNMNYMQYFSHSLQNCQIRWG